MKAFAKIVIPAIIAITSSAHMSAQQITSEWDKTFAQDPRVNHSKIQFHNRYGNTLVADLYIPKEVSAKPMAAIAVSGPYGAVKEQVSGRYAQELAARGYLTIAFDPSFTGESSGETRNLTSPEISTEDFSAAVDYLISRDDVDPDRIGILGICGWGGFALNAAAVDTRIRATVTSTMYDMSRVTANGYFDQLDADGRYALRQQLAKQRNDDYASGSYALTGGVVNPVPDDAPLFVRQYNAYYRTERGWHKRSPNSTVGKTVTAAWSFINFPLLAYTPEIRSAVLMVHGSEAHSLYFSKDVYANMMQDGKSIAAKASNKELYIVEGANHTDLYDNMNAIPFDHITEFYNKYLTK